MNYKNKYEMAIARKYKSMEYNGLIDLIDLGIKKECVYCYSYDNEDYLYIHPNALIEYIINSKEFTDVFLTNDRLSRYVKRIRQQYNAEECIDSFFNDEIKEKLEKLLSSQQNKLNNLYKLCEDLVYEVNNFNLEEQGNSSLAGEYVIGYQCKSYNNGHIEKKDDHNVSLRLSSFDEKIIINDIRYRVNRLFGCFIGRNNMFNYSEIQFIVGDSHTTFENSLGDPITNKEAIENLVSEHRDVSNFKLKNGITTIFRKRLNINDIEDCFLDLSLITYPREKYNISVMLFVNYPSAEDR